MDEQYFTDSQPASADELHLLRDHVRGFDLEMWVSDRVFSSGRIDLGTRQLIAEAPALPSRGTFLDLGCGWGPLAVTMALESPEASVWAVDVNSRAVDLTARNASRNEADNVQALHAEEALKIVAAQEVTFDVIWSNPPIRIGKKALHELLTTWLSLLSHDGVAYLVVQKNLGADSLTAWLRDQGFPSEKIASKKGFRIIEVHAQA